MKNSKIIEYDIKIFSYFKFCIKYVRCLDIFPLLVANFLASPKLKEKKKSLSYHKVDALIKIRKIYLQEYPLKGGMFEMMVEMAD